MYGKVKTDLSVRCFAGFLEKRGVVIKRGSRVKQLVLCTRSREKRNFARTFTRKLRERYVKELWEEERIYRLDSKNEKKKKKGKRGNENVYNPVQSQRFRRFFHLGNACSDSCATDKSQKNLVASSIYPTPPSPLAILVYTGQVQSTLNDKSCYVPSRLFSPRCGTSLLGCHPGVYHSVKPEIDNNKCLVKLWRRMG